MAARPDEKFNKRITGCPGDGVRRKQIVNLPDRYTRWASKETVYLAAAAAAWPPQIRVVLRRVALSRIEIDWVVSFFYDNWEWRKKWQWGRYFTANSSEKTVLAVVFSLKNTNAVPSETFMRPVPA
jgi:hypothetical protein